RNDGSLWAAARATIPGFRTRPGPPRPAPPDPRSSAMIARASRTKRPWWSVVAGAAAAGAVVFAAPARAQYRPDAVMLRNPDVSKDSIVFRFAGDLWLVDKRGGVARPLSSPAGAEAMPKFSPD